MDDMLDDTKAAVTRPTRRITPILAGYASGCLAAAIAFVAGLILHDFVVLGAATTLSEFGLADALRIVGFAFVIGFVIGAPVAIVLIGVTEVRGIRAAIVHAVFGAVTGLSVEIFAASIAGGIGRVSVSTWLLFAAIGAIGGLAYRAVALLPARPPREPPTRTEPKLRF